MKREELIAAIIKYPAVLHNNCYIYDVITNELWDKKKLNTQPNLILHIILRELRQAEKNK